MSSATERLTYRKAESPLMCLRVPFSVVIGIVLGCSELLHAQADMQTGPFQRRIPRQSVPITAAVQGIVRGPRHTGVGGVRVALRNVVSGQELGKITNADGIFLFRDIPPGTYSLLLSSEFYRSLERPDIRLSPGEVASFDLNLEESAGPPMLSLRNLPRSGPAGPVPPVTVEIAEIPFARELPRNAAPEEFPVAERLAPDENVFIPMPNRWRYDFPSYRRYNHPGELQYTNGRLYNSYNQNKLKGDYPIFGSRTFASFTIASETFADGRRLPTPSNVAAERPDSSRFFGQFGQYFMSENLAFSVDLFHGDTAFRPADWRIKITPEVNINYFAVKERGIVNIDPRQGTTRLDAHAGLQEAFAEVKLKDLSNQYDFVSARAGFQTFRSDFRGFIFSDQEPGVRIFGNLGSNRYQYNLAGFAMVEKDSNSGLNRFAYRHQQVYIANLYRQDFLKPGYTIQVSFHYDKDDPSFKFDTNNFLVRPAPIGSVKPHSIRAYYYGLTGDGHLGRYNITHAFYQVLGHDSLNELAGRRTDINAQMAAVELSLDRDWIRYRTSFFWASGDKNPRDGTARGFDAIFDNPQFGGGIFSFWNREGLRLTGSGVALVSGDSLVPSLRSDKIQGQANFVNPGLFLYNAGADVELTTKLRGFANLNLIRFDRTAPLELLLFQKPIHAGVGTDSGLGFTYRPPLSENITLTGGFNAFFPFRGFRDIYTSQTLYSLFAIVRFQF